MSETIIRQGELVGMGLMAYETTEEVGTVDYLLVNVAEAEVVGFACRAGALSGVLGRRQAVSWSQLVKIGRDRIVIHTAVPPSERTENQLAAAQTATGLEVWTDGGDLIGQVVDFCLDVETGKVQQYLFALAAVEQSAALETEVEETVEVFAIAPSTIVSAGRKRMMIAEEDAKRAQPYGQRIEIARADNPLEWRAEGLPADFGEALKGAQSFAGRVTERVRERAKKFSDEQLGQGREGDGQPSTLPEITEQLQAKSEQVRRQMRQRFEQAKDRVEGTLNDSSVGHSIGERLSDFPKDKLRQRFDRFVRPQSSESKDPIDVEAFEVWEDD